MWSGALIGITLLSPLIGVPREPSERGSADREGGQKARNA